MGVAVDVGEEVGVAVDMGEGTGVATGVGMTMGVSLGAGMAVKVGGGVDLGVRVGGCRSGVAGASLAGVRPAAAKLKGGGVAVVGTVGEGATVGL